MFEVDINTLYKEETYTDMKSASVRKLTPIKADGSPDESRIIKYIGHADLISPQGPIPIQTELSANSLEKAFSELPQAMTKAAHEVRQEYDRLMEQQQLQQQRDEKVISAKDFHKGS